MSSDSGLHSAYIYFLGRKRDRAQAERSYNEWLTKRANTRQSLIDQIQSMKDSNSVSKRSSTLLAKLEYRLAVMDSEDAEVAEPAYLKSFPSAYKSHRPAYVKLAFENTIASTEKAIKTAEESYRAILNAMEQAGELPPYLRKDLDPEFLDAPPPLSPESTSSAQSSKGPKQTKLQKLSAYLAKLESGEGMTKTFSAKPPETLGVNNSKWAFRAPTYYPRNPHAAQGSPSS